MADLATTSALGDAPGALRFDGCDLAERSSVAVVRIQAPRRELDALGARAGELLPFEPNRAAGDGPWILWRAPGDWLAYALDGSAAALQAGVEARGAGAGLVFADLSAGLVLFELRGSRAVELLLRDCTLDLEGDAVPPGHCAQTPIAQLLTLIHRPEGDDVWRLFVDRSAARYFWRWLVDTAELLLGTARPA